MGQMSSMVQQTEWQNPTLHAVAFDIFYGPGKPKEFVEVKPGDSVMVPSQYDNAIQTIRDGVIVGGKAPQLVARGRKEVPMHDALARAAAQGDVEREMLKQTGTTAGSLSFDMGAQLMKQANEAKEESAKMKATNEALMARLAALEAREMKAMPEPVAKNVGDLVQSEVEANKLSAPARDAKMSEVIAKASTDHGEHAASDLTHKQTSPKDSKVKPETK